MKSLNTTISKKKFEKYSRHDYSLFEERKRKLIRRKRGGIIVLVLAGLLFVSGLSLSFLYWMYPFMFSMGALMIATFALPFFLAYYSSMPSYKFASDLFSQENSKKLLEIANQPGLFGYRRDATYRFAVSALVDLKSRELVSILYDSWEQVKYYPKIIQRPFLVPLEILAAKLGFHSIEDLTANLSDSRTKEATISIPITQVYFIDKLPKKAKCMVSSLPLNVDKDAVVACPYCGNMAKQELLAEWLEKNSSCPVCRKTISINECPIVKIQD